MTKESFSVMLTNALSFSSFRRAERTVDSHNFKKALTAWHDVIALGDPTPRGIKRFVNRVRLFAMRERAVYDDKTEASQATSNMENILSAPQTETPLDDATLVALAALHHVDEYFLDTIPGMPNSGFVPRSKDAQQKDKDLTNYTVIRESLKELRNIAELPWPPTPEQIARFKVLAQGFHIR